jgi:hypothetical protein
MEYFRAAESFAFFATGLAWIWVWKMPTSERVSSAGFATALCFALTGLRLAVGVVVG